MYKDRFDEILADMSALHTKKGKDYGGENDPYANVRASAEFGVPGWVGAIIRLNDKITRIKSFIRNGNLANESLWDSLRDISVYGVIAQILYQEEEERPKQEFIPGFGPVDFEDTMKPNEARLVASQELSAEEVASWDAAVEKVKDQLQERPLRAWIEWYKDECGVHILDPDGFDHTDPNILDRPYTKVAFLAKACLCTCSYAPKRFGNAEYDTSFVNTKDEPMQLITDDDLGVD